MPNIRLTSSYLVLWNDLVCFHDRDTSSDYLVLLGQDSLLEMEQVWVKVEQLQG